MRYLLRKWYFDLLTPEQEYVFVYFAYVQFLGTVMRSLTLHCSRPGGVCRTRSFAVPVHEERIDERSRRIILIPDGEIIVGEEDCSIVFSRADCSVDLHYATTTRFSGTPVSITTGGKRHILWKPIGLKYQVSGTVTIGGETIPARRANGYVDFLESSCLPPAVPIRTLHWGRMHSPSIDLVYMHAAGNRGKQVWSRLYVKTGGEFIEGEPVSIIHSPDASSAASQRMDPQCYDVGGEFGSGRVRVKIHHGLPVQQGSFVDQQEIRSRAGRLLLKLLTRDPRGTKYLSRADVSHESGRSAMTVHGVPLITEVALL